MTNSSEDTKSKADSTPNQTTSTGYEGGEDNSNKPADSDATDNSGDVNSNPIEDMYPSDKPKEEVKEDVEIKEDVEVKDPATGYDDKPEDEKPKEDDKPKEDEKPKEGELSKEDVETSLKELPEGFDKDKVSKFALDNKMSKEQLQAYVEFAKADADQLKQDQETQLKEQKASWHNELKSDPVFGGENFAKSIHKAEQMLDNHMPNLKKALTDKGGMLPPYIMRDLLGLSKVLNPTTNMVKGDQPGEKESKSKNFLEDMYQ